VYFGFNDIRAVMFTDDFENVYTIRANRNDAVYT